MASLAPDLSHLRNDRKIKWIFVGGKGGVGKTTTSCSLSLQMAAARPSEKGALLLCVSVCLRMMCVLVMVGCGVVRLCVVACVDDGGAL